MYENTLPQEDFPSQCLFGDADRARARRSGPEAFGKEAGLADGQLGLGHAFEINPSVPDSFLLELAHAQLVRQLFPDAPLKYMPPTKHMTGNVFAGYLLDAFFNLCGAMTGQSILLIGLMTDDEGLFASYSDVQFKAPVLGGDVIEATATVARVGRRSRELVFEARAVCRADPDRGASASRVL